MIIAHSVDVVASQDEDFAYTAILKEVNVLINGVSGAAIPVLSVTA
jgi:hypothetical protein